MPPLDAQPDTPPASLHPTLQRQIDTWLGTAAVDLPGWSGFLASMSELLAQNADTERLEQEIADRKRAEEQLVRAARSAGMAEVAISVLHNVGNVLNSVNVSATVLEERLRASRLSGLWRVAELLRSHSHDLGEFLATDPKGPVLVEYLEQLAQYWTEERDVLLEELRTVTGKLQHIKEVVSSQQSLSRAGEVIECVAMSQLVEDAVKMSSRQQQLVDVDRDMAPIPGPLLDRPHTLQILVNLLNNAFDAVKGNARGTVTVRTRLDGSQIVMQVEDNGLGIRPDDLARIFSFGFTTKPKGHGFGLHTSALSARDMGGSLSAESAGLGQGSRFTLRLPYHPAAREAD